MSGPLPPILLALAALGGGWWLGSRSANPASLPAPQESPSADNVSPSPAVSGFARRAALLQPMANPSMADIQRLLNSGKLQTADIAPLIEQWAKKDPAGLWNWLEAGG